VIVVAARFGEGVLEAATTLVGELHRMGIRAELDDRLELSLGRRIVDHELGGIPLRIELGPRELAAAEAMVARRARDEKRTLPLKGLPSRAKQMLEEDQQELLLQAKALRNRLTHPAQTLEEAQEIASEGFARISWRACGADGESRLAEAGISVRCLVGNDGRPIDELEDDEFDALLARAY
jgi:prolyl-tRNA synthetase